MCKQSKIKNLALVLLSVLLFAGYAGPAYAVEGAELINNARAKIGNITPGDAPGFPVTISKPGNYVLTGNLQCLGTAIDITSSFVTLDLNGFTITADLNGSVITASEGAKNVTILSGNIRGGGPGGGLYLKDNSVIERITFMAGDGGLAVGNHGKIRDCIFTEGTGGISAGEYSIVSNNIVMPSAGGISVGRGSRATGNLISASSFVGMKAGPNSIVEDNTVADALTGIKAESGCSISRNTVSSSSTGIEAGSGSKVTANTVTGCRQFGLSLAADAGYSSNVLTGNNGGSDNPQVSGGIEMGANVCGSGTICP
jgi:hypothetical protein